MNESETARLTADVARLTQDFAQLQQDAARQAEVTAVANERTAAHEAIFRSMRQGVTGRELLDRGVLVLPLADAAPTNAPGAGEVFSYVVGETVFIATYDAGTGLWRLHPEPIPHVENYITASAATTISDTTTFFQVAGTFTNSVPGLSFTSAADGQLTYTGLRKRMVHIFSSWGVKSASNNQEIEIGVRKNGAIVDASIIPRKIATAGDVGSSALHSMITMATGDTIDVAVRNTSGANNLTFTRLNLGVLASPNDMTGITAP